MPETRDEDYQPWTPDTPVLDFTWLREMYQRWDGLDYRLKIAVLCVVGGGSFGLVVGLTNLFGGT